MTSRPIPYLFRTREQWDAWKAAEQVNGGEFRQAEPPSYPCLAVGVLKPTTNGWLYQFCFFTAQSELIQALVRKEE